MNRPTRTQLLELVGRNVVVEFKTYTHYCKSIKGKLCYAKEFSKKYGYRMVGFYINDTNFKVSDVKKVLVI